MSASPAYAAFAEQFLGPRTSDMVREGPLFHLLTPLTPAEREEAASALVQRLKEPRPRGLDTWAVSALGRLARMGTAMPPGTEALLRGFLSIGRAVTRAEVALAVWDVARDETMLDVVLALTRGSRIAAWIEAKLEPLGGSFELIQVIHCLAQFPQPAARQRLEEMRADPRYLIRYNAGYALGLRQSYYGIEEGPTV